MSTPVLDLTRTLDAPSKIDMLSYTDMIAVLGETNRCPGGLDTIRHIARETFLNNRCEVLEIGSNTGYTSLELSRLTGCRARGIDVNPHEIAVADGVRKADVSRVRDRVSFAEASAYELPFDDETFDLVVTGGAFSFMDDRRRALGEAVRVLRPWGHLSVTNLCSLDTPDPNVLADVSSIIGADISDRGPGDWTDFYDSHPGLERVSTRVVALGAKSEEELARHVAIYAEKPDVASLTDGVRDRLLERWHQILSVFNRNHERTGFVGLIYRKPHLEQERELFGISSPSMRRATL